MTEVFWGRQGWLWQVWVWTEVFWGRQVWLWQKYFGVGRGGYDKYECGLCGHAPCWPNCSNCTVGKLVLSECYFIDTQLYDFMFVCWLLNIPATCECVSGTDLLRQFYMLPHWDRCCRSNFPSHPVTVYWHQANQSQHWPFNTKHLSG